MHVENGWLSLDPIIASLAQILGQFLGHEFKDGGYIWIGREKLGSCKVTSVIHVRRKSP